MPGEAMPATGSVTARREPLFGLAITARPLGRAGSTLLLVLLGAALLVPIWSVRYVPLVDYPNHLASAFVLAHLHDPAFHFSRFYSSHWNTFPYLMMDWLLVGLQWLAPIHVAGRLLLSLTALSVPAAAWFFVRRANPGEESLAFWSLLIAENLYFFQYGFINMQLSLALCLVLLGVWLGYLARPRLAGWAFLLILTTSLYFTHLMGFGVAGVVMSLYLLLTRQRIRRWLLSWALFLPGCLFFLHSQSQLHSPWQVQFRSLGGKLSGLLSLVSGASPAIDFLTLVALLLALLAACSSNKELRWNRPWLGVAAGLFLLYWAFPARYAQGMNADRRLLPFVFVIALAGARLGRRGRQLAMLAVLLFLLRTGTIERRFVSLQPQLSRLAQSFAATPANARVLPLVGWQGGRPSPVRNFWAYGVIDRGWLAPTLFHDPGVQPLQLQARVYNPYSPVSFGPLKAVDWNRVQRDYDYVWAYDVPKESASLSTIADPIFQMSGLAVFRIGRARLNPQAKLTRVPSTSDNLGETSSRP